MTIYTAEFKLKVVKEYLTGPLGGRMLAKKYGLSSNSLIYSWKHSYELFGEKGLLPHRSPKKYTGEFKQKVVHFIETTGASFGEAARHFQIPSGWIVSRWYKHYLLDGPAALSTQGGRPKKMKKTNKHKEAKKLSREKELEREVEYLRIENDYLKKLRTFQQNIMANRNDESKPE